MTLRRKLLLAVVLLGVVIGFLALLYPVALFLSLGGQDKEAREIPVTDERRAAFRDAGYPITLLREFEASAYNRFNGDGASVSASLFPPRESGALIEALKAKNPGYAWGEASISVSMSDLPLELLPRDFLPERENSPVLFGRPTNGLPMHTLAVDRSRGILYFISNRF